MTSLLSFIVNSALVNRARFLLIKFHFGSHSSMSYTKLYCKQYKWCNSFGLRTKTMNRNKKLINETALFTRAELTIKDNNDIIVANQDRRNYSIKRTWRYEV